MFGYVKPYVPELRVCEHELFRAVYCGLCRSMGAHTGTVSRFTLSYDYVFLGAVRMVLAGIEPQCISRRCIAHPVKRRSMAEENPALEYTAFAAACMMHEKLCDDAADEHGFRKIGSKLVIPYARHIAGKADMEMVQRVHELTLELYALEKASFSEKSGFSEKASVSKEANFFKKVNSAENAGSASVDETAEAFGAVLAYVFSYGLEGNSKAIAGEIGRAVGRFVYICDAADDLAEDCARGRYNPIYSLWGDMALAVSGDGKTVMSQMAAESVRTAARIDLERLGLAVELLPLDNPLTALIKNTAYLGMPHEIDRILKKYEL